MATACQTPASVRPVVVVDTPSLKIIEAFGRMASNDSTCSLASVVTEKSESPFKCASFDEFVICTEGAIDVTFGAKGSEQVSRVGAGQSVFLPQGLRAKWTFLEAGTKYTALCLPAFAPDLAHWENSESAQPPTDLDTSLAPQLFEAVNVVVAPDITITEHFGNVASRHSGCSLATAVVRTAAEEAYQAPGFDEYVFCTAGSIEFVHATGNDRISAGEAIFLPKSLRVKWIWPEATQYTVVCLPGFTPELSGREADESGTVAKDSDSMTRLEKLHEEATACLDSLAGA